MLTEGRSNNGKLPDGIRGGHAGVHGVYYRYGDGLDHRACQRALINVMYETASAIGTVGLTADLTPSLARGSQAVIMVLMYVGRIGPADAGLVFAGKPNYRDKIRELPNERIMVG